jgi:hypothetical protein
MSTHQRLEHSFDTNEASKSVIINKTDERPLQQPLSDPLEQLTSGEPGRLEPEPPTWSRDQRLKHSFDADGEDDVDPPGGNFSKLVHAFTPDDHEEGDNDVSDKADHVAEHDDGSFSKLVHSFKPDDHEDNDDDVSEDNANSVVPPGGNFSKLMHRFQPDDHEDNEDDVIDDNADSVVPPGGSFSKLMYSFQPPDDNVAEEDDISKAHCLK